MSPLKIYLHAHRHTREIDAKPVHEPLAQRQHHLRRVHVTQPLVCVVWVSQRRVDWSGQAFQPLTDRSARGHDGPPGRGRRGCGEWRSGRGRVGGGPPAPLPKCCEAFPAADQHPPSKTWVPEELDRTQAAILAAVRCCPPFPKGKPSGSRQASKNRPPWASISYGTPATHFFLHFTPATGTPHTSPPLHCSSHLPQKPPKAKNCLFWASHEGRGDCLPRNPKKQVPRSGDIGRGRCSRQTFSVPEPLLWAQEAEKSQRKGPSAFLNKIFVHVCVPCRYFFKIRGRVVPPSRSGGGVKNWQF